MPHERARSARLEPHIAPDALALVRHAAELKAPSVSDFASAAAQEAANQRVADANQQRIAPDDQRRFADALLTPPALAPAMERARDTHRRLALGID